MYRNKTCKTSKLLIRWCLVMEPISISRSCNLHVSPNDFAICTTKQNQNTWRYLFLDFFNYAQNCFFFIGWRAKFYLCMPAFMVKTLQTRLWMHEISYFDESIHRLIIEKPYLKFNVFDMLTWKFSENIIVWEQCTNTVVQHLRLCRS